MQVICKILLTLESVMYKIASDLHFFDLKSLSGGTMAKVYHTKTKDLILEYIQANKDRRFRAAEIYLYFRGLGKEVNLTTIYRNLDKLEENKLIMKYKTAEDGCATYQYVEPHGNCHEHLHLQCRGCGKIIHLECHLMNEIREHLSEHHGFYLECPGSVLVGLCGDCEKKLG